MRKQATNTAPQADSVSMSKQRKVPLNDCFISEKSDECSHTIFRYTPKKARQICVSCGSVRRFNLKSDGTATVGPWRPK